MSPTISEHGRLRFAPLAVAPNSTGRGTRLCLLIVSVLAIPAFAQDVEDPAIVIRSYDITDLIRSGRDHRYEATIQPVTRLLPEKPSSGGFGGGVAMMATQQQPQGLFSGGAGDDEIDDAEIAFDIITLLQETVIPESWRSNGGVLGSISEYRGTLIISAPRENHTGVEQVLAELRKTIAGVIVRAKWVAIPQADVGRVLDNVDLIETLAPSSVVYQGQTRCFSGQRVYIASGHGRGFVIHAEPIVGNNAAAYQAELRMAHIGALLEIKPTVIRESKMAVVELSSAVSEDHSDSRPGRQIVATTSGDKGTTAAPLDNLDFAVQHFGATLKMPLNTPVIVGGMTMPGGKPDKPADPLYLVVEIIVED